VHHAFWNGQCDNINVLNIHLNIGNRCLIIVDLHSTVKGVKMVLFASPTDILKKNCARYQHCSKSVETFLQGKWRYSIMFLMYCLNYILPGRLSRGASQWWSLEYAIVMLDLWVVWLPVYWCRNWQHQIYMQYRTWVIKENNPN